MGERVTIVGSDSDYATATYRNVVIVVGIRNTRPHHAHLPTATVERLTPRYRDGIGFISVVEEKATTPNSATRAPLGRFIVDMAPYIRCGTVIIGGSGFFAATARGISSGLMLVARPIFPQQVFKPEDEAVPRMAPYFME